MREKLESALQEQIQHKKKMESYAPIGLAEKILATFVTNDLISLWDQKKKIHSLCNEISKIEPNNQAFKELLSSVQDDDILRTISLLNDIFAEKGLASDYKDILSGKKEVSEPIFELKGKHKVRSDLFLILSRIQEFERNKRELERKMAATHIHNECGEIIKTGIGDVLSQNIPAIMENGRVSLPITDEKGNLNIKLIGQMLEPTGLNAMQLKRLVDSAITEYQFANSSEIKSELENGRDQTASLFDSPSTIKV